MLAAGWREQDLAWERLQSEALAALAEGRVEEAAAHWAAALRLAREDFAPNDLRLATSIANQGAAAALRGEADFAQSMSQEAEMVWSAGRAWMEALKPTQRARSSTFHLRLESKHPGGYLEFERQRRETLYGEGQSRLSAMRSAVMSADDAATRLTLWQKDRPAGFTDERKLLGAALLIAG